MSKDAVWPLQKAIYALLNGDSALTALAPIYDEIPQHRAYPYVRIGAVVEDEWRTHDRLGVEVIWSTHIYSQAPGNKEALLIKNEIARLLDDLDDTGLTVTGWMFVASWFDGTTTLLERGEGNKKVRHVILRHRIKLQEE